MPWSIKTSALHEIPDVYQAHAEASLKIGASCMHPGALVVWA